MAKVCNTHFIMQSATVLVGQSFGHVFGQRPCECHHGNSYVWDMEVIPNIQQVL